MPPKITNAEKVWYALCAGQQTIDSIARQTGLEKREVSAELFIFQATRKVTKEWSQAGFSVWSIVKPENAQRQPALFDTDKKQELIINAITQGNHLPRAIARHAGLGETETVIALSDMTDQGLISQSVTPASGIGLTANVTRCRRLIFRIWKCAKGSSMIIPTSRRRNFSILSNARKLCKRTLWKKKGSLIKFRLSKLNKYGHSDAGSDNSHYVTGSDSARKFI